MRSTEEHLTEYIEKEYADIPYHDISERIKNVEFRLSVRKTFGFHVYLLRERLIETEDSIFFHS